MPDILNTVLKQIFSGVRDIPMTSFRLKHLMEWKLSVKILLNVINAPAISRLLKVALKSHISGPLKSCHYCSQRFLKSYKTAQISKKITRLLI